MGEGAIAKHHVNKRISRSRRSARCRPKGARNDEPDEPTNDLRWDLIVLLALLGLVRPLLSISGVYDSLGGERWAPVLVTILVAAVWVYGVFVTRAPNPLLTLVAAGGLYGVFAILLQQIIWTLFLGGAPEGIPSSAPVLVMSWVSILVTNTIWGAFLRLVAMGLHRLLPRRVAAA